MDSLAGRVRDRGGASACASPSAEPVRATPAAAEAKNLRRDRRRSRSSMAGGPGGEGGGTDHHDSTAGPAVPEGGEDSNPDGPSPTPLTGEASAFYHATENAEV